MGFCGCALVHAQIGIQPGVPLKLGVAAGVEVHEGMLLSQGDIFIGKMKPSTEQTHHVQSRAVSLRGYGISGTSELWSSGLVPYVIDSSLSRIPADRVRQAILHWNHQTRIELFEIDEPATETGLPGATYEPQLHKDYLVFRHGPGCASWVGRQGGPQTVWISGYCGTGSIVHEIGHALGLLHEHTRVDRDNFINVNLANVAPAKSINFDVVSDGAQLLGSYDYASVMHYGRHFFSSNGEPTMTPLALDTESVIGQRQQLSAGDISSINQLYASDASLNIDSHYDPEADITRVDVDISVQAPMGANGFALMIETAHQMISYSSRNAWVCHSIAQTVNCKLRALDAYQQSALVLELDGKVSASLDNTGLATLSMDTDLSNNGASSGPRDALNQGYLQNDIAPGQQPSLMAAHTAAGGTGPGSPGLLLLLLVAARQRCYWRPFS